MNLSKLFKGVITLVFVVSVACFTFVGCTPTRENTPDEDSMKIYLTINSNRIEVTLADNPAVDALVEILKKGEINYTASEYGGWEMVGDIGHTLPRNDTYITAEPGDVMLYLGSNIVLFYGNNSYSYTRLGKISGYSVDELKTLLCAGSNNVQITISLK